MDFGAIIAGDTLQNNQGGSNMALIGSATELRETYREILENKDIQAVSRWNEKNHSDECDEECYLSKTMGDAGQFMEKIDMAIQGI